MKYSRYAKDSELSYALGIYPVIEFIKYMPDHAVEVILSAKAGPGPGIEKIKELAGKNNIPVLISDTQLSRLTSDESVVAATIFNKYVKDIDPDKNHVVLVNPSDMGNLGTIIRTCLSFKVKHVGLVRPAVDMFDPRVIRASMGAVFHMNIQYFNTFEDYIFNNNKGRTYYLFMTDGEKYLPDIKKADHFSLIFGSEGAGLDPSYKKYGTTVVIPQSREADSLNLSVAVGIGLYNFFT